MRQQFSAALKKQILPGAALGLLLGIAILVLTANVPSFEEVRAATRSSEALLRDRDGNVIQRLRLDRSQRMLNWTPLERISPNLLQAVVSSEDKRFWWHPGVDPIGVASALVDNLHRTRPRGASTISMQLAGLLGDQATRRSWRGKFQQVCNALALELRWSKREILEAWLNRLPFRGELIGIDAASRGLLAKGPGGLDDTEAAVLAALIRAPSASRNSVARRACAGMREMKLATQCGQAEFVASGLPYRPYPLPGVDDAPHLARRLLRQPGEDLRSSIDGELQRFASETLRTHLAELTGRNVEDGAVIVLDNRTGEVLAYVGSSGDLSGAAAVDGVAAQRQPGSTLKPFLYGLAIDQRWLTSSSVLDDSPLALNTPSGLYIPQDYDRNFRGAVSVRAALGSSLNVPAVRTLTLVGVNRFLDTLRDFGLASMQRNGDHYGFGLALGAAETSLLELTNGYRALGNGGTWSAVRFTPTARDEPAAARKQVLSPQASFIIADILADPVAREMTFGFSSALSTHTWAAVKTGTSKGMRDNWAMGFTDRYTVGVWVGNFSGAAMWDVSGVTGAAPVWRDIVEHLHATQASVQPAAPADVQRQQVVFQPPIEAPRNDWFIAGTSGEKPGSTRPVIHQLAAARPQLIMPQNAAVIAPDPDIPQALQYILLQASGASTHCLRLDGKAVAACGQLKRMLPLPAPGRHRLELVDAQGTVLDTHGFEVRAISAVPRASQPAR